MTSGFLKILPVAVSFLGAVAVTPLVRGLARRLGMVARPNVDRWHKQPTALMGGVGIFVSVVTVELLFVPQSRGSLAVLGTAAFMFLVGAVDDLVNLKPYQKLAGQILGAVPLIACGLELPWTGSPPLNALITMVWVVGLTNAVNLLDNMDGLAAGISAIGCATLGFHFYAAGQTDMVVMLAVLGAALLGFLAYNTNPASIFMGDCGSLFIGSFLAGAALLCPTSGRTRTFLPVLAVPVLTLFIPIFDTVFVMVLRKLMGRPVSRGGRDHTSHRLVALGLSERRAVFMLYTLAALAGVLAVLVQDLPLDVSLAAIAGFTIVLSMLGFQLARVKVYDESEVRLARERPLVAFLVNLSYKRRLFEVGLDVLLIALSYYTAHVLVHGTISETGHWERFLPVVAVLIAIKLPTFLALGVYRGLWKYVSLDNLVTYAAAVGVGSAASVLALLAAGRLDAVSPDVVSLDLLILLALVSGTRLSFRLLRRLVPPPSSGPSKRVLIFGAGDAGVLLARELFNNQAQGLVPVGFADDDPFKIGSVIHGLRVYDVGRSLAEVCRDQAVDEVLISSPNIPPARLEHLARECRAASLTLKRMRIELECLELPPSEPDLRAPSRIVTSRIEMSPGVVLSNS